MAAFSLLLPAGVVLVCAAGLDIRRAWNAALGGLAASGIGAFLYWSIGFGFQFGGVGLVYTQPQLAALVWEWSALSANWGPGWGMAGLSGWFLSGSEVTLLVYALFLAHVPWVMTAAIIPVIALRGRAPATATLLIAVLVGGVLYPIAGNWVQGGGWLSALGRNLALGHGLIDYGGAGTVFLTAGSFGLAALMVWVPRRTPEPLAEAALPPAHLPLLGVVGSVLVLGGSIGWLGSNPLQVSSIGALGLLRGSVSIVLCASGGVLVPLLYSWFVTGQSDPLLVGRGFVAGTVAGLAGAPFLQPGPAFLVGFVVGSLIPFITFASNVVLRLDDVTGLLHMCIVPASVGLLMTGLLADGAVGSGWQMTGENSYLGVSGQGVSGLLVARSFQPDFPGQLQAQLIGVLGLGLWGFLTGLLICTPLSLLYFAVKSMPTRHTQPVESLTTLVPGPSAQTDGVAYDESLFGQMKPGSPESNMTTTPGEESATRPRLNRLTHRRPPQGLT